MKLLLLILTLCFSIPSFGGAGPSTANADKKKTNQAGFNFSKAPQNWKLSDLPEETQIQFNQDIRYLHDTMRLTSSTRTEHGFSASGDGNPLVFIEGKVFQLKTNPGSVYVNLFTGEEHDINKGWELRKEGNWAFDYCKLTLQETGSPRFYKKGSFFDLESKPRIYEGKEDYVVFGLLPEFFLLVNMNSLVCSRLDGQPLTVSDLHRITGDKIDVFVWDHWL